MTEIFIEHIKSLIGNAETVAVPNARICYYYSVLASGTSPESVDATVYGLSLPDSQIQLQTEFKSIKNCSVSLNQFPPPSEPKKWEKHPGKVVIIAFINSVTQSILSILAQWDNIINSLLVFFVVVFGKTISLPQFKNINFKKGTTDIKQDFGINGFPKFSVLTELYEIASGDLEKAFIPSLHNLMHKYSVFESVYLYNLDFPFEISVFNTKKQEYKTIALSKLYYIDFWDNKCIETYNRSISTSIKSYKIYAGIDPCPIQCKYSLGPQGLKSSSIESLKIISLPTTILINNSTIVWKGNRDFEDFPQIIKKSVHGDAKEGKTYIYTDDYHYIEDSKHKFYKALEKELSENQGVIDLHLYTLFDTSPFRTCDKKYRTKLVSQCASQADEEKTIRLYDVLKEKLPNLQYECIPCAPPDSFMITEVADTAKIDNQVINISSNSDPDKLSAYKQ
jgi:hypothetical protein